MSSSKNVSLSLLVLSVVFCVCLVASNLFETKLVQIGPISMTAGFLVFPISYIINDVVAEVWGYRKVRLLIWLGFFMNFLVVAIGRLAVLLPAAPFWKGEEHFDFVFGLAPRIACASFIAFIIGSFLNAWVMSRMKISDGGKHFSIRAVVSTLVGETGDSLIFFPIAFWGLVSVTEMLKLMAVQIVAKTLYEIIVLPITIRIVKWVKYREQTDVFDHDVDYRIWRIFDV